MPGGARCVDPAPHAALTETSRLLPGRGFASQSGRLTRSSGNGPWAHVPPGNQVGWVCVSARHTPRTQTTSVRHPPPRLARARSRHPGSSGLTTLLAVSFRLHVSLHSASCPSSRGGSCHPLCKDGHTSPTGLLCQPAFGRPKPWAPVSTHSSRSTAVIWSSDPSPGQLEGGVWGSQTDLGTGTYVTVPLPHFCRRPR